MWAGANNGPSPSWSYETAQTIALVIEQNLAPLLLGESPFGINRFHERAGKVLNPSVSNGFPIARAALDVALHDLAGQIAAIPVHELLGGALQTSIELCSAIGVDSPEAMAARAVESSEHHAYKVKISGDVAHDLAALAAIREVSGGKPLWLDANQSYTPSSILRLLAAAGDMPELFCVEQPVPSTDWAGMQRIRARSPIPVAIDEGSFTAADLARNISLNAADMVVIKICKSGGLRQARETASVAGANGMEILASGLTDCGVGFAASLHLFSTMNLAMPAELNGPELLNNLYVEGLTINNATAQLPTAPGLGVSVDEERIMFDAVAATRLELSS